MKKNFQNILAVASILLVCASCNHSSKQKGLVYFNDFESCKGWTPGINLCKFPVYSGVFAYRMDSVHTFGPTLRLKFDDISPLPIRKVKYSMQVFLKNQNSQGKIVVAVDAGDKKNILWEAKHIQDLAQITGHWVEISGECNLYKNDANALSNFVSIYPWNISKEDIFIDDMRVEFVL